jgi:4a-hydroxytetrahydrobiopterin dehydratase
MADHLTPRAFHHTEVSDEPAPSWWILADQDGNEACVATWIGTDGQGYPD